MLLSRPTFRLIFAGLSALLVGISTGCASFASPGVQSFGRGANPLEKGTVRTFASGGGGVGVAAVGGAGAGVEAQVTDSLSLGASTGVLGQVSLFGPGVTGGVIPRMVAGAGNLQALGQYNPGADWWAVRGRASIGLDAVVPLYPGLMSTTVAGKAVTAGTAGLSLELVTSPFQSLPEEVDVWGTVGLSHRRFVSLASHYRGDEPFGFFIRNTELFGATFINGEVGASYAILDDLKLFGAASLQVGAVGLVPVAGMGLQAGASFSF